MADGSVHAGNPTCFSRYRSLCRVLIRTNPHIPHCTSISKEMFSEWSISKRYAF